MFRAERVKTAEVINQLLSSQLDPRKWSIDDLQPLLKSAVDESAREIYRSQYGELEKRKAKLNAKVESVRAKMQLVNEKLVKMESRE